jgi:hypothetical protein
MDTQKVLHTKICDMLGIQYPGEKNSRAYLRAGQPRGRD